MKFRKDIQSSGGSKNFIKLKDKESIVGIFRGEPKEMFVVWDGNKSKEVSEGTAGAKFRFRINFVVKEGPTYVAKVFEGGSKVYEQLAQLNEEYELDKTFVKISRSGSTMNDTSYAILPVIKQAFTKETEAVLKTLTLNALESKAEAQEQYSNSHAAEHEEELPF